MSVYEKTPSSPSIPDGLGNGQTWQDKLSARSLNTWYKNTTGRTKYIAIVKANSANWGVIKITLSLDTISNMVFPGGQNYVPNYSAGYHSIAVPDGYYYKVWVQDNAISQWRELTI